jgi:hypothetical protein
MKRIILLLALLASTAVLRAQEIAPLDFVQLYQYFQADLPRFAYNTNDYLMTVDKNWIGEAPDKSPQGDVYIWGYYTNRKTYHERYGLIGAVFFKQDHSVDRKLFTYLFTGKALWEKYQKQMVLMNATELNRETDNGGLVINYAVNDLMFSLVEYPPGIKGNQASYEARLYKGTVQ